MFCPRLFVLSILLFSFITSALFGMPKAPLPSRWDDMLVKHKWNAIPDNWVSLGPPAEGTAITLYIALKPDRENALIDALHEVSQPGHPKYGAHLSMEQVSELVAPHPHTLQLVNAWLEYNSVSPSSVSRTHGGGWLTVTGVPVAQANRLLGASYKLYHHSGTNDTILRTVGYTLPAALHTLVENVAPTTSFTHSNLRQQKPRSRFGESVVAQAANATSGDPVNMLSRRDSDIITPPVLRWMYKTDTFDPVDPALFRQRKTAMNRIGIVGYENEYPSESDLGYFMSDYREDGAFPNFDFKIVNNTLPSSFTPSYLANLGAQYTSALVYPTPVVYYVGISGPGDSFLEWVEIILNNPRPPQTLSMAFGIVSEMSLSQDYVHTVCRLFGQLGARGVSILVASGDIGVGLDDCINPHGRPQFYTTFPASCPYVTSVGGTVGGITTSEVASNLSGGGFSAFFPRPYFQSSKVTTFLNSLDDGVYPGLWLCVSSRGLTQSIFYYANLRRRGGRGVPDIASQSGNFRMVFDRQYYEMEGTSCSTHAAAAIVSLINGFLISRRQSPLGWLNLWLYGLAWKGLNDITSGQNPGCHTDGFNATVGWDPVTGLGSPDFQSLQSYASLWSRTRPPGPSTNKK